MKKKIGAILLAGLLLFSAMGLIACKEETMEPEEAFIGTFTSSWIEGSNTAWLPNNLSASFTLTVNADRTFSLSRAGGESSSYTRNGTWAGTQSKDDFGIVCFFTIETPGQNTTLANRYFTLTQLDDGRIVAAPGVGFGFDVLTGGIMVFERN